MDNSAFRICRDSLLIASLSITPWYLFAKLILNWGDDAEVIALAVFILFYFPLVLLIAWIRTKTTGISKEEKAGKFFMVYGKGFALIVSLQFLTLVIVGLLMFYIR